MPMLHNGLQLTKAYTNGSWHNMLKDFFLLHNKFQTPLTLANNMVNNIFPLYTKTQNYHLKYPNVLH